MQGRGSAANSAVCYALGITAVDPVGMELLFERFLSEERGEWPDIDLDLPSGDQRERPSSTSTSATAQLGAAMTANVITYRGTLAPRARSARRSASTDGRSTGSRRPGPHVGMERSERHTERQFREAGFDLRHPRVRKFCRALPDGRRTCRAISASTPAAW